VVTPFYIGLWWTEPQKTLERLDPRTAQKFFAAAIQRRKLHLEEIITLLSECHEIGSVTQAIRISDRKKLVQQYTTLSNRREIDLSREISVQLLPVLSNSQSSEVAEMLVYAHLNRKPLPNTNLAMLQEKILPIYPFLADRFLNFLADSKYSDAMKTAIHFVKAIKQATISDNPPNQISCPASIPRLCMWNNNFRVIGQSEIYTNSKVLFWCHAYLHDSDTEFSPIEVKMENSDDEEGDVGILLGRKTRKNEGDTQILQSANTPYYPEVSSSTFLNLI
jgi:Sec63 Brl domain